MSRDRLTGDGYRRQHAATFDAFPAHQAPADFNPQQLVQGCFPRRPGGRAINQSDNSWRRLSHHLLAD